MFWSHFQQQGLALLISTTQSLFERQDDQIIDAPLDLDVNKKSLFPGRRFSFGEVEACIYYENVNFTAV